MNVSFTVSIGDIVVFLTIVGFGLKAHGELVEIRLKVRTLWDKYVKDNSLIKEV